MHTFHARGYTFTENVITVTEISILQKVAESRKLCATEIWSYTVWYYVGTMIYEFS